MAQLFISRFIQALASSSVFVLGLSTVHDNVPSDQLGKTLGLVTIAISIGTSAGTMVAGMLLELVGYWATWSAAYVLIACDAIMRLLLIEQRKGKSEPGEFQPMCSCSHLFWANRVARKRTLDPHQSPRLL